jgi:phosphoglycolate phosphatase-like HAD superfamily hydrolase
MDDVERLKPDPEGLHFLLGKIAPRDALYLGDVLDDALAARHARVPFIGVLARGSEARRVRAGQLREHGARLILDDANDLERHWK